MIETIFIPSCRAAVLIFGLFLLRWGLGNRISSALRHAFWVLIPLALLPMAISSPVSVYNLLPAFETADSRPQTAADTSGAEASINEESVIPLRFIPAFVDHSNKSRNGAERNDGGKKETLHDGAVAPLLPSTLLAIWLLGCAVMLITFTSQVLLCRRWLAEATLVKSENVLTLFEECRRQMRVNSWLVVAESKTVSGPFLIGVIRPTLLLPQGMIASVAETQLRAIFLHELAHLKRWDVWTGWLATVLLTVHWFNPMLWIAIRRMNADREEASDALALQALKQSERIGYAYSLLDITERFVVPNRLSLRVPGRVGISETGKFLERRIDMIKQNRTWTLRWKILALFAVLCIGAATLTDAQERRRTAEIQADIDKLLVELREAKETEKEPVAQSSALTPNAVKEGTLTPPLPVQDRKKVNIKGHVLMPNGEVADGINFQFSGYPTGWTISNGGGQEISGDFNVDVPGNDSYVAAVFDKRNRFAAPMQTITVSDESPEGKLVFQFEAGVPFTAAFVDQETDEPIPGLRIHLMQKADVPGNAQISFEKMSDEKGLFQAHVMPGEYVVAVDLLFSNPEVIRKGIYARKFIAEEGKPISLEFRIPSPFVGKVLNVDGTPAKDRMVFVLPSERDMSSSGQTSTFIATDQNGIFRRILKPVDVTVSVLAQGGVGQYFAWFKDELAEAKEHTFQLVEGTEVTGRLLDAKTNEPLGKQLFFYWKMNPNETKQKAFLPDMSTTDSSGRFWIRLNPTVLNDLFIVYGRQSMHGGGPYEPRMDIVVLGPEQLRGKNTVDLGDVKVGLQ